MASVGIHPNSAAEASDADFAAIAELARAPEVVAIGETGLDYYRDSHAARSAATGASPGTCELAEELGLPVDRAQPPG